MGGRWRNLELASASNLENGSRWGLCNHQALVCFLFFIEQKLELVLQSPASLATQRQRLSECFFAKYAMEC